MEEIKISCPDYKIIANKKEIVDLTKGFGGIHDLRIRKSAKNADNMDPAKLDSGDRYKRYFVRIDANRYYRMMISYEHEYKTQVVYQTNMSVSEKFRSQALTYVLNNLMTDSDEYKSVRRALIASISLIARSYSFDRILTDIPEIAELNLGHPIQFVDVSVVKRNPKYEKLNLLMDLYKRVPLRVLPVELILRIDPADTTISDVVADCPEKVLFISGLNKYSTGWIYRELVQKSVILPVTLFNLGSY